MGIIRKMMYEEMLSGIYMYVATSSLDVLHCTCMKTNTSLITVLLQVTCVVASYS